MLAQQLLVEHRGARVGDDGASRADRRATGGPDDPRPAVHEVDVLDALARTDLDAGGPGSRRQRRGQHPRATARRGEPDVLRQHAHQPAEQPAARGIRRDVSVHRVAQQHHSPTLAGEALLGHPGRRQEEEPRQPRHVGRPDRSREPRPRLDRRPPRQQRVEERLLDVVPLLDQLQPRGAVLATVVLEGGRRLVDVGVDRRAGAVVGPAGVAHHDVREAPLQAVVLQAEPRHHRRRDGQRVAGAELVHHPPVPLDRGDGAARPCRGPRAPRRPTRRRPG